MADLARLAAALWPRAAAGRTVGYALLADEIGITGPGRIGRLAALLEAGMTADAAAGRPFLASLLAARGGGGLPAAGFFAKARALGRHAGGDTGPEAAAFVAAERAALREAAPERPDAVWAFARYEALRSSLPSLPASEGAPQPRRVTTLAELADAYDAFLLDGFGVLNVGAAPVPGAPAAVAALRAAGKRVLVLTNAATRTRAETVAAYSRLGLAFAPEDVIPSRDLARAALTGGGPWCVIAPHGTSLDDLEVDAVLLGEAPQAAAEAAGFLFLGSDGYTAAQEARVIAALRARPRPLVVANPDVVAPHEAGFTLEPGHFAQRLAAASGIVPQFCGKPFGNAFAAALARLPGIPRARIAMVGDSPHTDILGARAAGIGAVLVTGHGLLRGRDPLPFLAASGLWPDAIFVDP